MYLYGAGGHAKVVIDILRASKVVIDGIYDDNEKLTTLLGYSILSTEKISGPLIVSVGDNKARKRIVDALTIDFGRAIYPAAIVSDESVVGEGSVIMQGGIIQSSVTLGKHCIVNSGASVGHDCTVGDFVHISPHATLCGGVRVGEGSWIGAGSVIIPGVEIGKWSVIGAGSVVTKNIPDYSLAVGNKCEIIKSLDPVDKN